MNLTEIKGNSKNQDRAEFAILFFFCAAYCIGCYWFSQSWYLKGLFDTVDIFFDTDTPSNLDSFAHGDSGRLTFSHPLIELLSVFPRSIEYFSSKIDVISNKNLFREKAALWIGPFFSSLTIWIYYQILRNLSFDLPSRFVFTLLFAFSFSNLIFAILPETYPLSCFLITLLIHYYILCMNNQSTGRKVFWFLLAFFLGGTTITNVVIFFIVFSFHLHIHENKAKFKSIKTSLSYSFFSTCLTMLIFQTSLLVFETEPKGKDEVGWVIHFMATSFYEISRNIPNLFSASVNALLATSPSTFTNASSHEIGYFCLTFMREKEHFLWLILAFMAFVILIGKSIFYRHSRKHNEIIQLSIAIILFNFILHTFFGNEMFLYTQHWITPLTLLLTISFYKNKIFSTFLVLSIIFINISFLFNVKKIIAIQ